VESDWRISPAAKRHVTGKLKWVSVASREATIATSSQRQRSAATSSVIFQLQAR